jgi:uroporphyrinogen III methyltransferase/synthase
VRNGKSEETPAAVIADATFATQKVVKGPLGGIAAKCREEKVGPPAIIVIGAAAESDARFNWFMTRPLFGRTIVVTRDRRGNAEFAGKIVRRGGNPIEFATIDIKALTERSVFLETLSKIREYDWVVFTSANGVRIFFDALARLGEDGRILGSAKVAAIGPATAGKLGEFGIRADFVPGVFTGRELALQLMALASLRNRKVLLLRSEAASKEAAELLAQGEAVVEDVGIYSTAPVKGDVEEMEREIGGGRIDWVTFASPSAVRSFFGQIAAETVNSSRARVASIGPVTSAELTGLGVRVDVEAGEHTLDGLLAAMRG